MDLHALSSARGGLHLTKLHVLVEPSQVEEAETWIETAMQAAYPREQHTPSPLYSDALIGGLGVKAKKRVLVLVNPVGGKGKARSIVKDTVLPIFEAAGCTSTMMGGSLVSKPKPSASERLCALTSQRRNMRVTPSS